MEKKQIRYLFILLLRAAVLYFSVLIVSFSVRNIFFKTYFAYNDTEIYSFWINVVAFFPLVFVFYSYVRHFSYYNATLREGFLAKNKTKKKLLPQMREAVLSLEFLAEFSVIAFLAAVLPISVGLNSLILGIFGDVFQNEFTKKSAALAVILPIYFILSALAHFKARRTFLRYRNRDEEKRKKAFYYETRLIFNCIVTFINSSVVFIIAAFLIYIPNSNLPTGKIIPLIIWIAAIIVFFILTDYIRAFRRRKKFVISLKKLCTEQGFKLGEIKHPYLSLFRETEGISFSVSAHGKNYDCKLLAGKSKNVPMYFEQTGKGFFRHSFNLRKTEIFHYIKAFDFNFLSEHKKIVIISPIPKMIYSKDKNGSTLIDTGCQVGEYKVFNGTGFLGSLERDCIER